MKNRFVLSGEKSEKHFWRERKFIWDWEDKKDFATRKWEPKDIPGGEANRSKTKRMRAEADDWGRLQDVHLVALAFFLTSHDFLKRDFLSLKDSWRDWKVVLVTFSSPSVFLSTSKKSLMHFVKQGVPAWTRALGLSHACQTQHVCMSLCMQKHACTCTHTAVRKETEEFCWAQFLRFRHYWGCLVHFSLLTRLQVPSAPCKASRSMPISPLIHVCGWAVCGGRNECSP